MIVFIQSPSFFFLIDNKHYWLLDYFAPSASCRGKFVKNYVSANEL